MCSECSLVPVWCKHPAIVLRDRQPVEEGVSTGSWCCCHTKQRIFFYRLHMLIFDVEEQLTSDAWLEKKGQVFYISFRQELIGFSEFNWTIGPLNWQPIRHVMFKCTSTWAWAACSKDYEEISSSGLGSYIITPLAKATCKQWVLLINLWQEVTLTTMEEPNFMNHWWAFYRLSEPPNREKANTFKLGSVILNVWGDHWWNKRLLQL